MLFVASLAGAATSADTDNFSGTYQLRPSKQDPPIQLVLRKKDQQYALRVIAGTNAGPNVANVESKFTLVTDATLRKAMDALLPGSKPSAGIQCGGVGLGLFCYIKPGTMLEGSKFVARTGYFMLVEDLGPIEATKLSATDSARQ
ncbi:hypothetical protein GCM10011396_06140 [Undibacterium terreum]|uniref:Uncharacterized protein n=2 Tax=Undibacterium terreum TaxID=1224302 RepID=A0A916U6V8_9BURK|nr:hypothetical protein GCM10011396_06140 [Undibacterium terreum]